MHSQSPALPPLPPFLICNSKHLFYILQRFLFLNKAFTKKKNLSQLGEQSAVCLNRATVPLEMTCAAEHRTDKTRTVLQHLANLASTYFQRFLFAESCKKKNVLLTCTHPHMILRDDNTSPPWTWKEWISNVGWGRMEVIRHLQIFDSHGRICEEALANTDLNPCLLHSFL